MPLSDRSKKVTALLINSWGMYDCWGRVCGWNPSVWLLNVSYWEVLLMRNFLLNMLYELMLWLQDLSLWMKPKCVNVISLYKDCKGLNKRYTWTQSSSCENTNLKNQNPVDRQFYLLNPKKILFKVELCWINHKNASNIPKISPESAKNLP